MGEYVKYAILLIVLAVVQKTLIWLLAVTSYDITPDIVLIGLVYISIQKGKITGSVGGFVIGLILDFFSFSFLGLMALSKTTAALWQASLTMKIKSKDIQKATYLLLLYLFVR